MPFCNHILPISSGKKERQKGRAVHLFSTLTLILSPLSFVSKRYIEFNSVASCLETCHTILISHTGSGCHPASYTMGTGGNSPWGKADGTWNKPSTSFKCKVSKVLRFISTPPYVFMASYLSKGITLPYSM